MTRTKRLLLFAGMIVVVCISAGVAYTPTLRQQGRMIFKQSPTPTPLPFAELTIPYLRNRSYQSTLTKDAPVSEYAQYTSHLSHYTSDALRINALLTIPTGKPPAQGWPAIVFVHGYIPPAQYATTERYVAYVDALARAGYVVLKIDLRGHGQSEGEASGAYYSADYVVDVLHAYAALSAADFVDHTRIGLWGHSMAGNLIARAIAVNPRIPAAVVWGGAVFTYDDFNRYSIQDSSYRPNPLLTQRTLRRNTLINQYGPFDKDNIFWRQVSPLDYLSGYRGAIQLHHAQDDAVVNVQYSVDFAARLTEKKVPHQLYTYPTGGHNIEGPSFDLAMQRTIAFFAEQLP